MAIIIAKDANGARLQGSEAKDETKSDQILTEFPIGRNEIVS